MTIMSSQLNSKELCRSQTGIGGAKIYANHQRVWLGTFKSEIDAAMAYDIKHFPPVVENTEENTGGGKLDEVHLFFYDRLMSLRKFRYCYWKSSQSFVFTKGWNRFVKEKELKANDVIAFYVCEGQERAKEAQAFCVIDIGYNGGSGNDRVVEGIGQNVDMQLDLCRGLRQYFDCKSFNEEKKEFGDQKVITGLVEAPNVKKSVRLFGVDVN
ncbi:AP2/ERF and B3 domain-containing transcription factor [Camellia lanceoleosa]|uniref:AP2/ERF and B3 domain-containing transcription factor n=1 Tax=Camellia lanceoleosa TaxID=1840588 RepID=A0ACC0GMK3_9ERIC|nr:AP2/ERF and B3 domain-containing transcription factor [Camellia lanceoleosa]